MKRIDSAESDWAEIASASAFAVAALQRENGLWAFPANDDDRGLVYAAAKTSEETDRLGADFGFESLTVTWNALEALTSLSAYISPRLLARTIAEVRHCHAPDGGFGSRFVSYQGVRINPATRHTSLALMIQLTFGSPAERQRTTLKATVEWLLKQQRPELRGGWPFDEQTRDTVEPMSTASCIAALAIYLNLTHGMPAVERRAIEGAIKRGFTRLMRDRTIRFWAPRYDSSHFRDNVFIFDMLDYALAKGNLARLVPKARTAFRALCEELLSHGQASGWPATWKGRSPSLSTTISVLYILKRQKITDPRIESALRFIAKQLVKSDYPPDLTGWDWIMLGRLASEKHLLTEAQARAIYALVGKFSQRSTQVTRVDLVASCPRLAQGLAAYVITRGVPGPILERLGRRAPTATIPLRRPKNPRAKPSAHRHVFLSYCREDLERVRELRSALVAQGETVWWDQDLQPGQDWKFEVRCAIERAYAVVICLSQRSASRRSSGIYPEAAYAIAAYREYAPGSIFLIPVRFSKCAIPPIEIDASRTLKQLQYLDLFPASQRTERIRRLVRAIRAAPYHPSKSKRLAAI